MNKRNWLGQFNVKSTSFTQFIISLFFFGLAGALAWSLNGYWQNTLKPRLYLVAQTQANVLAESQAAKLKEILTNTKPELLNSALLDAAQLMLIVEDPAIGERAIRHLQLQIDYATFPAPKGSLDLSEGETLCSTCFITEVPLINRQGELVAIATFNISDGYYRVLSREMESKLIAESTLSLGLIIIVWLLVSYMFYRLNKAKKYIEASDRAKTRFLANVTHELRTPLNAILGHTQLYRKDEKIMSSHSQGINSIDRNAEHLLLMINDILEFSSADEEHIQLHPTEVNFKQFFQAIVEMAQINAQIKNLEFHHYCDPAIPAILEFDAKRLRQVLLNLLSNAVKFTTKGCVSFTVNLIIQKASHCRVRFNILDTGIGIEKSELNQIFIPFNQLDNKITRAEGTGLGLAISQRIINLMGSKLEVKSEKDGGSQFSFNLSLPVQAVSTIGTVDLPQIQTPQNEPTLPANEVLDELIEQCKQHNILGIRTLVSKLEDKPELSAFLIQISPYIKNYRFKQLYQWLESKRIEPKI